jgi:hypothetical protein
MKIKSIRVGFKKRNSCFFYLQGMVKPLNIGSVWGRSLVLRSFRYLLYTLLGGLFFFELVFW